MTLRRILLLTLCVAAMFGAAASVWAEAEGTVKDAMQAPSKAVSATQEEEAVKEATQAPAEEAAQTIDQRALDTLKTMSNTLAQAKTMSFQVRSMVPIRTPDGIWINLYGTSRVIMQAPDKLFAGTAGDFAAHDFYFDGKTITSYSPDKNLYTVRPAPATIDAMIEDEYTKYGKSFPYADILVSEPYEVLTDGLTGALYVGVSTLRPLTGPGGIKTEHLVFSNKGVEWQIWIGSEDHLPHMVVATYLDDTSEPSYSVEFGDWKINDPVDPTVFVFGNASNASKVEFRDPAANKQEVL